MPLLRDLNCSIEPSDEAVPLQELGTVYGDGVVETFVPVPKKQQTFTVHLSSTNFIAPGIAMYVFIDGIYQCNRNRQNMKLRKPPDRRSLVDFKVRQKEERQKDGSMIAREWTFEKLDHATADSAPASSSPTILANIGCIEVVVLRCAGPRKEKTDTNLNMDGAADYWLNHHSRSRATAFDDRNPFASAATSLSHRKDSEYHTHGAKTARSRRHSRKDMSRPISPHTRFVPEFPMPGVQYGTGPLPPESSKERHRDPNSEAGRDRASRATPAVDPVMLEKIVADAVKRGVAESKKEAKSVDDKESIWSRSHESDSFSQIPGAWPSPGTDSSATEKHRSSRMKAKSREGLEWDETSMINGWGSLVDDPTNSWEDDDTWPSKRPESWEKVHARTRGRTRTVPVSSMPRWAPHVSKHKRSLHRRASKDSSTSLESSESTVRPYHSSSQMQPSRIRASRRKSNRARSSSDRERKPSQPIENPRPYPDNIYQARPSVVVLANAPTMAPAPIPPYQMETQSRRPSVHTQAPTTVIAPPPTWGCASEKTRKNSAATSFLPPAPFSTTGEPASRESSGSSWGVTKKTSSKHGSVKRASSSQSLWGEKGRPEKARSSWGDADKDGADWGDDKGKGWGSENADEKEDTAWKSDKKVDDGWGSLDDTKDASKDAAVDGWEVNDKASITWGKPDTKDEESKEQPSGDAEANGWSDGDQWNAVPNSDSWGKDDKAEDSSGFEASADPWGLNQKASHGDTCKPIASPWGASSEPAPKDKTSSQPPSKRHTSKSLSKYRQLSTPPPTRTSHRQFPPPLPKKTLRPVVSEGASDHSGKKHRIPSVPAEPLHKIPLSTAEEKGVQHQVLAGPGTQYGHAVSRPEYIDRLDDPYAVFRFKYRSRSALRSMFGDTCLSKTGTQKVAPRKEELEALSRDELVKRMMALQTRIEGEGDKETQCTQSVAKGLTEKWVKAHSREVSEVEGWKRA